MCDTQVIRQKHATFFAKNSDREASEAQVIVRIPAVQNDDASMCKATYISIPQVANRFGLILSKPYWMWGGEMGVNDQGVVIGNEAIFSRLIDRKGQSLLGMDLLRLGLERGASARHAMDIICHLLEQHGQGGPAGYRDKSFCYDNSFLIADAEQTWVLETAGRAWVAKKIEHHYAISNALTLKNNYDLARSDIEDFTPASARKSEPLNAGDKLNFAQTFDSRFMPMMGAAHQRRAAGMKKLNEMVFANTASLKQMMKNLRQHYQPDQNFKQHDNRDICMHAGSLLRPSQTCASMVVELRIDQTPKVMMTGTSAPCLSLFKVITLDEPSAFVCPSEDVEPRNSLWFQFESVHRRALSDAVFRHALISSRDSIEQQLLTVFEGKISWQQAEKMSLEWHQRWYQEAFSCSFSYHLLSPYEQYWRRLTKRDEIL